MMVTDMLNENESLYLFAADGIDRQVGMDTAKSSPTHKRVGSIRELELIAAGFRRDGESCLADEIELEIMALLDKKICRKIIKRSRREQKLLHTGII